jgi:hypothetical protein
MRVLRALSQDRWPWPLWPVAFVVVAAGIAALQLAIYGHINVDTACAGGFGGAIGIALRRLGQGARNSAR